ncbi:MAG: Ig-like domain-containing protein [Patescibacteria group bacterium]
MKKSIIFFIILLLVIVGFVTAFGFYEIKYFTGRASVSQASFSIDNSYIFSTPSQARANGQEKIRLTVFILNNQGLGVMGKKIFIGTDQSLNIEAIQGLTDSYGKAYFDISATKPAEYFLEIKADDTALNQKAHLVFN